MLSSANRIPRTIRVLMRNESKLSKAILTSKSGKKISNFKQKLQEIEADLEKHYSKRRESQENDAISKIKRNPKYFYSYAKRFSKLRTNIGPFVDDEGEVVDNSFDIAEMLKHQYEKAFSVPDENALITNPEMFFAGDVEDIL